MPVEIPPYDTIHTLRFSKQELLSSLGITVPDIISTEILDIEVLSQLINQLILVNCFSASSDSISYIPTWQWQHKKSRQRFSWIQYPEETSIIIEQTYQSGTDQCSVHRLSPFLAPLGHHITFNRDNNIHQQINISTQHTRNARRFMIINNPNYLYWLICLRRTEIFLQKIVVLLDNNQLVSQTLTVYIQKIQELLLNHQQG